MILFFYDTFFLYNIKITSMLWFFFRIFFRRRGCRICGANLFYFIYSPEDTILSPFNSWFWLLCNERSTYVKWWSEEITFYLCFSLCEIFFIHFPHWICFLVFFSWKRVMLAGFHITRTSNIIWTSFRRF